MPPKIEEVAGVDGVPPNMEGVEEATEPNTPAAEDEVVMSRAELAPNTG